MTFQEKYNLIVKKNKSFVCIGLDSDFGKIPPHLKSEKHPQFVFNKKIIDKTFNLVCAYKINSAFYEARGAKGIEELKMTCDYLSKKYSDIPIILDAKRGDIGNTNDSYAKFMFGYLNADAITINPYLGEEANSSFLQFKDKGIFILCKTSNPGADEFQNLKISSKPLYQVIAEHVANRWNKNNNCILVVGATYLEELKTVRKIVGEMIFLIPGIGRQGGDLAKTIEFGINSKKSGIIINSSRDIIFASSTRFFASIAREKTEALKNAINSCTKNL